MKGLPLPSAAIAALQPHFPELDLAAIRIHSGLPWYVAWWAPIRAAAFTASAVDIHCRPEAYRPDNPDGLALLAHELTHCVQYRRYGWWRMAVRYVGAFLLALPRERSAERAYLAIPQEREARERAAEISRHLERMA